MALTLSAGAAFSMTIDTPPTEGLCIVTTDGSTIAEVDALQGMWTQDQYLAISESTNHLIEFTDGCIEVLPMPTTRHQAVSAYLLLALVDAMRAIGGARGCERLRPSDGPLGARASCPRVRRKAHWFEEGLGMRACRRERGQDALAPRGRRHCKDALARREGRMPSLRGPSAAYWPDP